MNALTNTINATLAPSSQSPLGLWVGSLPPTLQQPTAINKQSNFSTVIGLTLASMLGGAGFTLHALPPTFADIAKIIPPLSVVNQKDSSLLGYAMNESQEYNINQYLHQHISTHDFLLKVAVIIDSIYGPTVTRNIHIVEDVDTGKPIMELTILSGLPLNDEFDQKDQLLFKQIEAAGLVWGLRDVVISQG